MGPGDTGTRASSVSQPASIHGPGPLQRPFQSASLSHKEDVEKRNGEQEREGGREKGEGVGTQAENQPPSPPRPLCRGAGSSGGSQGEGETMR